MIVLIFTALAVLLVQIVTFCNKKDRSLTSEDEKGPVVVPSPYSRPTSDTTGSASGSKAKKAGDSANGVRPTQESLETSPAYVEEDEVWEIAGELADERRAASLPVRSVTKTQEESPPPNLQGTPASSKGRTNPSDKLRQALKESSTPQAESASEGEKRPTSTDLKASRLPDAGADDMWKTFKKLEETQPDLIDYTSLMADPVLDENEADDQKEHKVGSLGDLLLQLKWAKAARAKAETSAKRPLEPEPEAQPTDAQDNQFARLLPEMVLNKPLNKAPTNLPKKSSNPSSKKAVRAKITQPNLQSPRTKSKKGQIATKSSKHGVDSGKKNVRGSEKKSSKKKSSKKKRK
ncbi:hypothetical protein Aduo_002680 [Ancylostoma duodenale]